MEGLDFVGGGKLGEKIYFILGIFREWKGVCALVGFIGINLGFWDNIGILE